MKTYIALLRGINVGGHHKVPMKELVRLLSGTGLQQVKTYIQTGNIIFRSEAAAAGLTDQIQAEIEKEFGFTPYVLYAVLKSYKKLLR